MIIIAGTINIDPDKHDAAADAVREVMAPTRAEDGCVSYAFSADVDDPGTFHLCERWRDEAALEAHMASAHLASFMAKFGELGVRGADLMRYTADDGKPLFG